VNFAICFIIISEFAKFKFWNTKYRTSNLRTSFEQFLNNSCTTFEWICNISLTLCVGRKLEVIRITCGRRSDVGWNCKPHK
jgi:hypothetical protein